MNKFSATRELLERTAAFRNLRKSTVRSETVAASPMSAEDRRPCMTTRIVQANRAGLPTENQPPHRRIRCRFPCDRMRSNARFFSDFDSSRLEEHTSELH